jgi:hypothetical protein
MNKLMINRDMVARRVELTREECLEKDMTPALKEVFKDAINV